MRCPVAFAFLSLTFVAEAPSQQLLLSSSYGAPTTPTSSDPSTPLVDGNRAWFTAASRDQGRRLWVTDGTAAGTHMAVAVGANSLLAAGQGHLLFSDGSRLWLTDGTLTGTRLLSSLRDYDPYSLAAAGPVNGRALVSTRPLVGNEVTILSIDLGNGAVEDFGPHWKDYRVLRQEIDGLMFFGANHSRINQTWVTDGTIAGSHALLTADQRPVLATGNFAKFQDDIYFEATHDNLPLALYRIKRGFAAAERLFADGLNVDINDFLTATRNGMVYLRGSQLWVTDGTSAETRRLAVPGLLAGALTAFGDRAVFSGYTLAHNNEPWITDGTLAGTQEVIDLAPGTASSFPNSFQVAGDRLFIDVTIDGVRSLRRSDGTAAGTITAATMANGPQFVVPLGNGVLYADGPDSTGRNLWFADGDAPPRQLTQSFMGRAPMPNGSISFEPLSESIRGILIFKLAEPAGRQLWRSDGTPAGTSRLCDFFVGPESYSRLGIPLGDRMLFPGQTAAGLGVYVTDGTTAGTLLTSIPGQLAYYTFPETWVPDGDYALLPAYYDLYRTDGTGPGTIALPVPTGVVKVIADADGIFGLSLPQLWRSDGSASGTHMIDDNVTQLVGSLGASALYIYQGSPPFGLYASDGGPRRFLAPIWEVDRGFTWQFTWHDQFWFEVYGQLWRTDGTEAGTVALPTSLFRPVIGHDALYYVDQDLAHGYELWRTDGTPAGTWRVTDVMPGPMDGVFAVRPAADRLFITARDPAGGTEPWISDGTAAGTFRLADLTPGFAPANPVFLGVAGEYLYFYANEGERNVGLYSIRLGDLGIAQRERLGAGCSGSAGRPTLDCSAFPHVGDGTFHFDLQHAPALAPVFLMLGTEHGITSLGPCVVRTAGDIAVLGTNASFGGRATWPQPIPALPSLIGVSLTAQAVVIDGGAQGPGFSVSDALLLVIGG